MARHAKCVANVDLVVVGTMRDGTQNQVRITKNWEGDLDRVIGETVTAARPDPTDETKMLPEKIVPVTVLDGLGDRFVVGEPGDPAAHFEVVKAKKPQPAPAAPQN
jgi:hypothetical protein